MALLVKLNEVGGSGASYSIMAETVEHSILRQATQTGLPSGEVFVLDLGIAVEVITISCIVDNTTAPTKADIRTAASSWYNNIDWGDESGFPQLVLNSSETYKVVFKNASFRQESGKEDRWECSLAFYVKEKVT